MKETNSGMDARVKAYIEKELGYSIASFPSEGIDLRESDQRSDNPGSRMFLIRIEHAAVGTAIPRVLHAIRPVIHELDLWEVFSPFGAAELTRALHDEEIKVKGGAFHYTLIPEQYLEPIKVGIHVIPLLNTKMVPSPEIFDKKWFDAFAVNCEGQQVSLSRIRWKTEHFIEIAVDTVEKYRGRGFGLTVVAAATEWILSRHAVAHYPVAPDNLPSVRIARHLGFRITWQEIYA